MRTPFTLAVLLLLFAAPALAQGIPLQSGQKVAGEVDTSWGIVVFRFETMPGDTVALKFKADTKSGLDAELQVLSEDDVEEALPPVVGGKLSFKGVLQKGGWHFLVIRGAGGTTGAFQLALKVKGAKPVPLVVAVPGNLGLSVTAGMEVSLQLTAQKGSPVEPGIDAVQDEFGGDFLDPGLAAEKGGKAQLKKQILPHGGDYDVDLAGRNATAGNVDVKLKLKPGKPTIKTLGSAEAAEIFLARVRDDKDVAVMVQVEGELVTGVAVIRPQPFLAVPVPQVGPGEFELNDAETANWPDGYYLVRCAVTGYGTVDYPCLLAGPAPSVLTITQTGPQRVEWSGGAGDGVFYVGINDPATDDSLYEAVLPGDATGHDLPTGLVAAGWPYEVEVWKIGFFGEIRTASAEVAGSPVTFKGAVSIGDLLQYQFDPVSLDYSYDIIEPTPGGGTGTLAPEAGWGGFVFTAPDEAGPGEDPPHVVFLPGRLVVGGTGDGGLFAAVPQAGGHGYTVEDITGVYNFIQLSCDGGDCEADWGTFRINADGTWEVWVRRNASGTPDLEGNWEDQDNGVLEFEADLGLAYIPKVANAMVHPSGDGSLLVIDLTGQGGGTDPGIALGVKRAPISPGGRNGTYNVLATDEDGLQSYRLADNFLYDPEGSKIKLDFNSPWDGFVSAGEEGDGGLGLVGPDGTIFLGGWYSDDGNPGQVITWFGAGILRR